MPTVLVTSPRGGAGASLLAANLAVALADTAPCLLLDLHGADAIDDLLLDLEPAHGWPELVALSDSLRDEQLQQATCAHRSGVRLLAGDDGAEDSFPDAGRLIDALAGHVDWLVVDCPRGLAGSGLLTRADLVLLVVTSDPPGLRSARRWMHALPSAHRRKAALVVNQVIPGQPLLPQGAGHALEIPLWARLPVDAEAIGRQVHFGEAAAMARSSRYGRAVRQLAQRLLSSRAQQVRAGTARRAKSPAGDGTS